MPIPNNQVGYPERFSPELRGQYVGRWRLAGDTTAGNALPTRDAPPATLPQGEFNIGPVSKSSSEPKVVIEQLLIPSKIEMAATARHLYTPLLRWQTRILRLHPAKDCSEPLEADLLKAGLAHDSHLILSMDEPLITFEAISYSWGGAVSSVPITLNGLRFAITTSLAGALTHFRFEDQERYLWADALCINQSDNEEKSFAVANMFTIYRVARRVLAWLGEAGPDTGEALALARAFHEHEGSDSGSSWSTDSDDGRDSPLSSGLSGSDDAPPLTKKSKKEMEWEDCSETGEDSASDVDRRREWSSEPEGEDYSEAEGEDRFQDVDEYHENNSTGATNDGNDNSANVGANEAAQQMEEREKDVDKRRSVDSADSRPSFEIEPRLFAAICELLNRPWIRRAWVQQEVFAAQDLTIYCGREQLTQWELLYLGREADALQERVGQAECLRRGFWVEPQVFEALMGLGDGEDAREHDTRVAIAPCVHEAEMSTISARRDAYVKGLGDRELLSDEDYMPEGFHYLPPDERIPSWFERRLVHKVPNLLATDPRDLVYAILNLTDCPLLDAKEAATEGRLGIHIDYSKSVSEVFQDATRFMINSSRSLFVLRFTTPDPVDSARQDSLPSWTIDWRRELGEILPLGSFGDKFVPKPETYCRWQLPNADGTLTVTGITLAVVRSFRFDRVVRKLRRLESGEVRYRSSTFELSTVMDVHLECRRGKRAPEWMWRERPTLARHRSTFSDQHRHRDGFSDWDDREYQGEADLLRLLSKHSWSPGSSNSVLEDGDVLVHLPSLVSGNPVWRHLLYLRPRPCGDGYTVVTTVEQDSHLALIIARFFFGDKGASKLFTPLRSHRKGNSRGALRGIRSFDRFFKEHGNDQTFVIH